MFAERLLAFQKSINNVIELRDFMIELRRVKKVAELDLIPTLEKYRRTMKTPTAPHIKQLLKEIKRQNSKFNEQDPFGDFITALETIIEEATVLEKRIEASNITVYLGDEMDIKHLYSVRFLSAADYLTKSIRSLTVCMVELEVAHIRGANVKDFRSTINYLDVNFDLVGTRSFASVLGFFIKNKSKDIIKEVYELEDISVDKTVLELVEASNEKVKIDPVGLSLLDFVNPLFYLAQPAKIWSSIKMWYLDYEKEELEYLEARHAELVSLKERGEHNPRDLKLIENYREAIESGRRRINAVRKTMG